MPGSLLLALSWRTLIRNGRRTLMLVLAVVVGVASLVLISALLRGWLASTVDDALEGLTGHIRLHAPGWLDDPGAKKAFALTPDLERVVRDDPHVTRWATRVRVPAVIMSERETRGLMLVGIDPARERELSFIGDAQLAAGEALRGPGDDRILLGAALARALGTSAGKRVVVMTQAADGSTVERGYRIAGIFDVLSDAREKGFAFTGRDSLAGVLGLGAFGATELSIRLDDTGAAELDEQTRWFATRFPDLTVRNWRDLMPQAAAVVEMSDTTIWIWYAVMMAALGFGLVNTLLASVLERVRELGLLQALGMRPSGILWQVLLESWLILGVGLVAGLVLGWGAVQSLSDGIDLGRWAEGLQALGMDRVLVPTLHIEDLVQIGAVVTVLGVLGCLYPARKAVAIDPLQALNRHQE